MTVAVLQPAVIRKERVKGWLAERRMRTSRAKGGKQKPSSIQESGFIEVFPLVEQQLSDELPLDEARQSSTTLHLAPNSLEAFIYLLGPPSRVSAI